MTKTTKGTSFHPTVACLGCGITREDIDRLKLDVQFIGRGAPCIEGTDEVLLVCSRCIGNPGALAQALAASVAACAGAGPNSIRVKEIAALLTLRDKAVLAHAEDHLGKFRELAPVMQSFCSQMDERLDRLERRIGLGAKEPIKEQRAKNGLMGAVAGAIIGTIVGISPKPLEALRAVINKASEIVAEAESRTHGAE